MVAGTLALTFAKVGSLSVDELAGANYGFIVKIGSDEKPTEQQEIEVPWRPQTLNFDLKDASGKKNVDILLVSVKDGKATKRTVVHKLGDFLGEDVTKLVAFKDAKVEVHGQWAPKSATQKVAGTETATAVDHAAEVAAATATLHPERALALPDTHRPWFMRASYYYDTTKHVYNYTTSFRLVAPVARLGERATDAVLSRLTGRHLTDLDQGFVAPTLVSLDDKVDETIASVLVKLSQGQLFVLQKKDAAVETATSLTHSTVATVGKAKQYTTDTIKAASSSAVQTVVSVKDYTTSQVVNVSSSAYGTVRGAAVYMVSHVPYFGAKIRA